MMELIAFEVACLPMIDTETITSVFQFFLSSHSCAESANVAAGTLVNRRCSVWFSQAQSLRARHGEEKWNRWKIWYGEMCGLCACKRELCAIINVFVLVFFLLIL